MKPDIIGDIGTIKVLEWNFMDASIATCKSCGPWWRLPLLLAVVLAAVWLLRDRGLLRDDPNAGQPGRESAPADVIDPGSAVSLAINFGNGNRTVFPPIPWREGMTIQDVMQATFRNEARFEVRGSGKAAFLQSIDGVANEGADGKNWTYTVNGESGDRGFAVYEVAPGDQVLWTFGAEK
jgi:hypothetical protein